MVETRSKKRTNQSSSSIGMKNSPENDFQNPNEVIDDEHNEQNLDESCSENKNKKSQGENPTLSDFTLPGYEDEGRREKEKEDPPKAERKVSNNASEKKRNETKTKTIWEICLISLKPRIILIIVLCLVHSFNTNLLGTSSKEFSSSIAYNETLLESFHDNYKTHLSLEGRQNLENIFKKMNEKSTPIFLLLIGSNPALLEKISLDYGEIFTKAHHDRIPLKPVTINNSFKMDDIQKNYNHINYTPTFLFYHLEELPGSEAQVLHQYADSEYSSLPNGSLSIFTLTTSQANLNTVTPDEYKARQEFTSTLLRQMWIDMRDDAIECVINRIGEYSVLIK